MGRSNKAGRLNYDYNSRSSVYVDCTLIRKCWLKLLSLRTHLDLQKRNRWPLTRHPLPAPLRCFTVQ